MNTTEGASTPRAAIANKCRDCTYDEVEPGTWREQCAACPIEVCPLYAFRPIPDVRIDGKRLTRDQAAAHVRLKLETIRMKHSS